MQKSFVLLLCIGFLNLGVALACDDTSCNECQKPNPDVPPPAPISWMEQSTIGSQPAVHDHGKPTQVINPGAKDKNWKVFPDKFQDVVQGVRNDRRSAGDLYLYLGMMAVSTLLMTGIVVAVHRGLTSQPVRRLFQILFLAMWVFVFAQCLCCVKDLSVLLMYGLHGKLFFGLCTAWLGMLTVVFTLVLRKKFRTAYCFWVCPVGTCQDLVETGIHSRIGKGVRIGVLAILAAILVGAVAWNPPHPLNLLGGPVLALLMIVFSVATILRPSLENLFRRFVMLSLVGWLALCITAMSYDLTNWTSGPWCVPGVANLKNPLVLTFVILMVTSLVMPRAWCKFVCPNRGLFEILSGKPKQDA